MILAFDVGNTNIIFGAFKDGSLLFSSRISTVIDRAEAEYAVLLKSVLELYGVSCDKVFGLIISSVVPPLSNVLKNALFMITGKNAILVGPGVKTGLNILIDNPSQLGSDFVASAVAAVKKYPKPLIILDMGTATALSVIDAKGNFLGVVICPGVLLSYEALSSHTAQLPRISFEEPRRVIGTNSVESMKSGLIYGSAAMIDGLIERIEDELGEKATVVASGGDCGAIIAHCRRNIIFDEGLVLEGLRIIYEKNRK